MTRGLIPKVPGVFQFDFLYTFCIVSKSDIDSQRPMFPETFYHKQDIRRTKSRWFCMVLSCAQVEKTDDLTKQLAEIRATPELIEKEA